MKQLQRLAVLPAALLLSGCAAAMAASAVGMAADAARGGGGGQSQDKFMQAAARQACSAHAAQYGAVQITGLRARTRDEIVVTGTVAAASGRQSFECSFVTEITGFELRPIQPAS